MPRARDSELTARVRAAWGYSGLTYRELAERTAINEATLRGYLRKSKPNAPSVGDAFRIADACGVPRSFMEQGFREDAPAPEERLEAVEHQMQTISRQVRDLAERLRPVEERLDVMPPSEEMGEERLAGDGPQAPGGALGRDLKADETRTQNREQKKTRPGQGAR